VLNVSQGLFAEYTADVRATAALLPARIFRVQHELRTAARRGRLSALQFEESVRTLLGSLFAPESRPLSERHRRIAARAQAFLAAHLGENVTICDVASAAGSSPHHLCRIFRRATGESLHRYQLSLRLRAALARIAAGEGDLTAVALDFGFADHSHFTNAFRGAFGVPPSRLRERPERTREDLRDRAGIRRG
jgi:AraC-like DNA-binding protein